METGDHFKNGAGTKSQTSRGNFRVALTLSKYGIMSYLVFLTVAALLLPGCFAARSLAYGNPPVIFAYPDTIPIIKDQSKVATIVARNEIDIEGINFPKMSVSKSGGNLPKQTITVNDVPSNMRVSNNNKRKESVVVDVLPGTYTIYNTYFRLRSYDTMFQPINYTVTNITTKDFSITVELEAGHIYWVTTTENEITIDKDDLSRIHFFTDAAIDRKFPNYLKKQITESRNKAK